MCSDCEAYGLKNHGLTRYDCIQSLAILWSVYSNTPHRPIIHVSCSDRHIIVYTYFRANVSRFKAVRCISCQMDYLLSNRLLPFCEHSHPWTQLFRIFAKINSPWWQREPNIRDKNLTALCFIGYNCVTDK